MAQPGEQFELFYSNNTIYSNFYPAPFTDPRLKFPTGSSYHQTRDFSFVHVEQYMHACKAMLFKDDEMLDRILYASDPMDSKKLGRLVSGFDDGVWSSLARDIVTRGCWLKFSQNQTLREEMLKTEGRTFVECAPRDRRWGIGLGINNPRAVIRSKWRGSNWLGECLDSSRAHIMAGTEPLSKDLSVVRGHLSLSFSD